MSLFDWFADRRKGQSVNKVAQEPEEGDGLWSKCPECSQVVYRKDLLANASVCSNCGHHHRIDSSERIAVIVDPGSFVPLDTDLEPTDPLGFKDRRAYAERLREMQAKTGLKDAVVTGLCRVENHRMALAVMDFRFMGGSMGSVVGEKLARLIEEYGAPEYIRSDNGSEFIEKDLREWLSRERIKPLYIEPGSPWQNGYIESFHARLREECLNREQLWTLTEARVVVGDWRWKYNNIRPHRSLGYISPIKFVQQLDQEESEQGSGSTRPTASFRQNLDFLYDLNHTIITSRLTNHVAQFG